MICIKCGREIANTSQYCPYCGQKQNPQNNARRVMPHKMPTVENGYLLLGHMSKANRRILIIVPGVLTMLLGIVILCRGIRMFLEILTDVATNQMNIWCGAAQFLLEFLGASNIPAFLLGAFIMGLLLFRKATIKPMYIGNAVLSVVVEIILYFIGWAHLNNLLISSQWLPGISIKSLDLGEFIRLFYPIGVIALFLFILDLQNKIYHNPDYNFKEDLFQEKGKGEERSNITNDPGRAGKENTPWKMELIIVNIVPNILFLLIAFYILGSYDYNVWGTIYL